MSKETDFETQFNAETNHLTIRYRGRFDAAKMAESTEKVLIELTSVRPAFTLLTDLSELTSMELACVPQIERVMNQCREKGVATIVRVVPHPSKDIGFNILSKFHYPRSVRIITCQSLAEAHRALGIKTP